MLRSPGKPRHPDRITSPKLEAGDDLDEVRWFSISEEFLEKAFEEDVEILAFYASGRYKKLPIDPDFACQVNQD